MKVVFYTPTATGGHARFSQCLMQGLHAARPSLELSLYGSEDLPTEYRNQFCETVTELPPLRSRTGFKSRFEWALSRMTHYWYRDRQFVNWVRNSKPDIVHLQEWFPEYGFTFVKQLQRAGSRVVVSVHNLVRHEEHFPLHRAWQAFFDKRMWRRADRLVVMSPGLARSLSTVVGSRSARVRYVPHFVWPIAKTAWDEADEAKCRRRTALLFGALRRNKGIEYFIDACARNIGVRGIIAGSGSDGDYIRSLEAMIAKRNAQIELRNRFYDEAELPQLFAESSVAVFPYTSFASQSGALFMAIANNTPVIGSQLGALGETIMAHGLGLTIPPQSAGALADALTRIHESGVYARARAKGRSMENTHSMAAVGESLAQIYDELCSGGPNCVRPKINDRMTSL